ncbi:MAG TPA: nuclear transport factor 2 family protein [Dehalococcoidia bacterium]|nr:nuclear transport factor 2 family protein [Dehalococcoidia bacterium]
MSSLEEVKAEIERLRREVEILKDIEAIKQLKGRYFRCIDCKLWDELADCFAEDAVTNYNNGREHYEGRGAIMEFLRSTLDMPVLTMHQGHHPEITITGETTAVGKWALEDYIITLKNRGIQCAAFYQDEYVKVDGQWKIKSTGYDLVYREMWDRNETKSLKILDRMHQLSTWEGR